jgi:hypothetical protein
MQIGVNCVPLTHQVPSWQCPNVENVWEFRDGVVAEDGRRASKLYSITQTALGCEQQWWTLYKNGRGSRTWRWGTRYYSIVRKLFEGEYCCCRWQKQILRRNFNLFKTKFVCFLVPMYKWSPPNQIWRETLALKRKRFLPQVFPVMRYYIRV